MAQTVAHLDINEKHRVKYCVPMWLRDEQIRINTAACKKRIAEHHEKRAEPIAVVCYGPSLNDTWQSIKNFKFVICCSGAHKFLVERGIIPTWHVEVDPRIHKIQLIGPPHKDVEYLLASTCHPEVFQHLKDFNVTLWHVFDNQADAIRTLPAGEWALTGGSSVGLRAMTIARFLGFTDLHIFGMDGSEGASGKHAAVHPNQPKAHCITTYNGVDYKTTVAMLTCAKETFHELDQMPDVKAKFYGDGLVQSMAKDYQRKISSKQLMPIGFQKERLISDDYLKLNVKLHRDNLAYGVGGGRYADTVLKLAETLSTQSVLDYGCGKGYLAKAIPFPIWEYDPAIPGKDESPRAADLVVCTDVLEHIEPDKLTYVLGDLARVTKKMGYFIIHTGPSSKSLADGRNTHLIQESGEWWVKRLEPFFDVAFSKSQGKLTYVLVTRKLLKATKNGLVNEKDNIHGLRPEGTAGVQSGAGVDLKQIPESTDHPDGAGTPQLECAASGDPVPSSGETREPVMVSNL